MKLDEAPVYAALTTKPMVLGLPQDLVIVMVVAVLVFMGAAGMTFLTIGGSIGAFVVTLPFLRRLFEKEPFALELFQSYMRWPKFMPHHARIDPAPKADIVPRNIYD
ncbi:MAG: VirB3 family type IV secretion system protein [Bacteroidetes bacterium]|nr:VirB3 family type IV secretion system protein [Bacteroidota bacterium]